MPNIRTNKILASGGFKGGGKTYQTYKLISKYVAPTDGSLSRKVIIFDTNYEYNYSSIKESGFNFNIKTIKLTDLPNFILQTKVEAARILPLLPNGQLMTKEKKDTAWKIIRDFRGGLVILDDINNYVLNVTHEEEFVNAIINNAHRNADVIINFQSINMINPILIRNLNEVRMHYEIESPNQTKFQERWEMYSIAKYIINAKYLAGQEKYCLIVDNLKFKIKGNFTKAEFAIACKKYIEMKNPKLIRQELTRVSGSNEDKNIKATVEAAKKLFIYWGN